LIGVDLDVQYPGLRIWWEGCELYWNSEQAFDEMRSIASPWSWLEMTSQSFYAPEFGTERIKKVHAHNLFIFII
jgi:hypothetical protein